MKMPKLYKSKKWLEAQRKKGRSIADIASECGVSYQMIDTERKKYGIK